MPGGCFLCYTMAHDIGSVESLPALRNDGVVTFGSFNALAKMTPQVSCFKAQRTEKHVTVKQHDADVASVHSLGLFKFFSLFMMPQFMLVHFIHPLVLIRDLSLLTVDVNSICAAGCLAGEMPARKDEGVVIG